MADEFNTMEVEPMERLKQLRRENPGITALLFKPKPGEKMRSCDGRIYDVAKDGSIRNPHRMKMSKKERRAYRAELKARASGTPSQP